jgi:hypothetical protein
VTCSTQRTPYRAPEKRCAYNMSYSPYLDRSRLHGKAAIEQMAHDFQTFTANAGSINQDDLEILGWTGTQVALHASDARRFANRRADTDRAGACA